MDNLKKIATRVIGILLITGIGYALSLQLMMMWSVKNDIPLNADYMIILGTKVEEGRPSSLLQNRIDVAVPYLKENKKTIVIASGGQGTNESISEAQAIQNELISQGIEEKRILMEDRSSRTLENISFSKKFIPANHQTGIVVSNTFHLYRAKSIATDQGLDVTVLPAGTPILAIPKWYIREYLAITKYYGEKMGILE